MRDISFGQYYPASSVVHRLDPRLKIIITIIYIVSIFFITSYTGYLLVFLFIISAALVSKIPFKMMLKSVKPMMFLIIFTVVLNMLFVKGENEILKLDLGFRVLEFNDKIFDIGALSLYWTSIDFAAKMVLRLLFLILMPSLLTFTTTPVQLTDAIESLLKPLNVIRFPVHELAIIMSIALRLIPTIMEETDKIILAQKARCADFDSGNLIKKAKALLPVLIPLFVSSIRRADDLAYAMDSRCYRGSKGRTKYKKLKYGLRDLAGISVVLVFFTAVLFLRFNYFNFDWITRLW